MTLNEKKIDLASIDGSFLQPKHKIAIPGYKIIRNDRSTGQDWGVALIDKDDILFDNFEFNISNNRGYVEFVSRKINTKTLDE